MSTTPLHNIELLLQYNKALTIYRTDQGIMLSLADLEQENQLLFFLPRDMLFTESALPEALEKFQEHQQMVYVRGCHA